jgi:hypothetical protein
MQIEYPSKLAEMASKADVEAVKKLLAGARSFRCASTQPPPRYHSQPGASPHAKAPNRDGAFPASPFPFPDGASRTEVDSLKQTPLISCQPVSPISFS